MTSSGEQVTRRRARAAGSPSLAETAYRAIKRRILDNAFPPGSQILEAELTEQLGMSRTPIREALLRLQNEGLVEIVPRHGMRVLPISSDDMREIYEIIGALEAMAIERLAEQTDADTIDRLAAAVETMEQALAEGDLDRWAEADASFHRDLVELSGNRRLERIVVGFWDLIHRVRALTLRLRPPPRRSTERHRALVEALRRGDATGARELHWEQRKRSRGELAEVLKRYNLAHL